MASASDGPLRIVVAVVRGYGTDSILFECGHQCSLDAIKGRRDYPRRRRCHNCTSTSTQKPMRLDEWRVSPTINARGRDRVDVLNEGAQWSEIPPEEIAARDERARRVEEERARAAAERAARDAAVRKRDRLFVEVVAEARRWRRDEEAVEGFCPEGDDCEHHECRLGRVVAEYEAAFEAAGGERR